MEQEIGDRINKKQFKVIHNTAKSPTDVYLGKIEMEEFCLWAKDFFDREVGPKPSDGMEFLGMKVHAVNEDSHFKVCYGV